MKQTIQYKGKDYPIRVITMTSEDTGTVTHTIADDTLNDALDASGDKEVNDTESQNVDDQIYFFVEVGQLNLSAKEICENCLDEKFEFVSED
jgi:hypothetical protein